VFPRINPRVSRTTIQLTIMDYFFATVLMIMACAIVRYGTATLWGGCVYVFHHWYLIFQLPFYWLALVAWLLNIIFACFVISLGCMIYYQGWQWTKLIFSDAA
jgi:hypothetical protein